MTPTIIDWLRGVIAAQPPGNDIIAFNIGLFETEDYFCVYLSGAGTYVETSDEWAIQPAYYPTNAFFGLHEQGAGHTWESCLSEVRDAVSDALKTGLLEGTPLANGRAVTAGFDDGELHRIK
jgi:hypothetical protein